MKTFTKYVIGKTVIRTVKKLFKRKETTELSLEDYDSHVYYV